MTKFIPDNMLHPQFKDFDKFFVGFDDQLNRMAKFHDDFTKNIPNYPPYNIKKTDENKYVIEMAVAGFAKNEIEIEFVQDKLIIKGNASEDKEAKEWLYQGIAARNFTRTFALNDQVEINGAELINGMLKIALERIIPDSKKPQKIDISDTAKPAPSKKQMLTEGEKDAISEKL
jgi:molecular chaperone IbpA